MGNDKGAAMVCGLYIGGGDSIGLSHTGTAIPNISSSFSVTIVDVVAEVCCTYRFINSGDLPINPTFLYPLNNVGVLCDFEVSVITGEKHEKRMGSEVDAEAVKKVLEQSEIHVLKFGEVAPNCEVTIKCTYVSILSIQDDAVKFVIPTHLVTIPSEHNGTTHTIKVNVSVGMHEKVLSISSPSHPESITNHLIMAAGKANADFVPGPSISTDLIILVRVNNIRSPRAWSCTGTSGTQSSRMSMTVVCPPFREAEGASKEGEVVLFLDIREQGSIEHIVNASLEKIPKWANFNVWVSLDGSSFAPIFERAVTATEENFKQAVVKINSRVPFAADDESLLSFVQSLISSPISTPSRVFFFVTSMDTHIDEVLKVLTSSAPTTRSIVVSLKEKWKQSFLPYLLHLNGGSVVRSSIEELEHILPTLFEKYIHPTQPLTVAPTNPPIIRIPHAATPFFHNTVHLTFFTYFDQTGPAGDIEVKGADANDPNSVSATLRQKETVNSQVLHRLVPYTILNELKAGLREDVTATQKDILQTILYSPWTFHPTTPKSESGSTTTSLSNAISMFKSGAMAGLGKTQANTLPASFGGKLPLGGDKLAGARTLKRREDILAQHIKLKGTFESCEVDHMERVKISYMELEPNALEIGAEFVRQTLAPGRQLTTADSIALRNIIMPIVQDTNLVCPDGTASGVHLSKLRPLVQNAVSANWKPEDESVPTWYEASVTAEKGSRPYMEDQSCMLDSAQSLLGLANQPRMAFFGVFDGHSGRHAAEYTKVQLPFNVLRNPSFDANRLIKEGVDSDLSIADGFMKTDSDFLAVAEKNDFKSGTTAVTLLLFTTHMIISNVGDSEAVVCRDGKAIQLSTLHTPLNEKEKQRVAAAGGAIVHYGTWRVNGVLAVTRSIGDRTLKAHVTSHPDTVLVPITEKDDFVILATDGLWEMVKYQDAVDFVKVEREKILAGDGDPRSISRRLVDEAVRKESKDNITAIVIYLKH